MTPPLVVVLGNVKAEHATEAAYRDGYTHAGCTVAGVGQDECFERGPNWFLRECAITPPALVCYSRTHNNTALGPEWTDVWRTLEARGTKTASVHLDVFWGLAERERWIEQGDPLFTTGLVLTADGGSDERWKAAGVNHQWLPPGCDSRFIPRNPEPIPELAGKIVFVGSAYGYHALWPHRAQMIDFASKTWPDRFVIYGNGSPNGPVRGEMLARVYASDCIVIGDFCFAGGTGYQWSDRIPETLGRGGNLVVTNTPGLQAFYPSPIYWEPYNFDSLAEQIERIDKGGYDTEMSRKFGREQVMRSDTYRDRARTVLESVGVEVPSGDD